ncbi:MAG: DNA glycosylase AlkZ-like family protein, partial [Anaerolineae bacterium]
YRSEMYTPAAQRQYGYYVLPILHRGRLVGRLDPKADRQANVMRVRAIYLEPGQASTEELVTDVAGALREFAAFHGSEQVVVEQSEPEELAGLLQQAGLTL